MFKLPLFRRGTRSRQAVTWLLVLLTGAVFLDRTSGPHLGDMPYLIRLFTTAEPSSLLLLMLVILLIALIGRPRMPETPHRPDRQQDEPSRLAD